LQSLSPTEKEPKKHLTQNTEPLVGVFLYTYMNAYQSTIPSWEWESSKDDLLDEDLTEIVTIKMNPKQLAYVKEECEKRKITINEFFLLCMTALVFWDIFKDKINWGKLETEIDKLPEPPK